MVAVDVVGVRAVEEEWELQQGERGKQQKQNGGKRSSFVQRFDPIWVGKLILSIGAGLLSSFETGCRRGQVKLAQRNLKILFR